ncbi:HU family DNA-binding protein [Saccharothrix sp. AJ9571]|nr:HU family DNA-binding protein [Saccharothrix sp. AJ9571]
MGSTEHPRISKREFISRVATRSKLPIRVVNDVYEALFGELTSAISDGEKVVLTGFGRFYLQAHKGHKVRFGGKAVNDYSVLKFSASRNLNRRLESTEGRDLVRPRTCEAINNP